MSLEYSIEKDDAVIRVRTEGLFNFLDAYEMWKKIIVACGTHNCQNVLGLSYIDEPLPQSDAYEHLAMLQSVGVTPQHRIAWVAGHPKLLDSLRIAETTLKKRSDLCLQVFENESDATRWLAGRD